MMYRILALCLVAELSACGGTFKVVEDKPLAAKGPKIKGFIVFPVADLTHDAKTIDAAVRGSDVAAWLLDRTEQPVLGLLDFKIFKVPDDLRIASVDTNLATRDDGRRKDLNGWIAVWVQITENRATNIRDIVDARKKGKKNQSVYRIHGVEATVRVEVQFLDAMRGTRLATIVIKDVDDPTQMQLKGDPRPRVTQLVHRALRMALAEAKERIAAETPTRIVRRAGTKPNAPALAGFSTPDKPSLAEVYAKKGDIDLKIAISTLWSRLAPDLGVRDTYFATKYPGVLLTADRAPLKRGDVILSVDGVTVLGRYQLDRAVRACKGRPCKVKIQRAFKSLTVDVIWLPVPRPEAATD